jgi:outer membrane lipoprotein-sorting protein
LRARGHTPALVAAGVALASCVRVPPPDLSADPQELLAQVERHQAGLRSVSGSARISVDAPGLRGRARALVAAERPGRIRMELLDFLGNPAATLVASDGRFILFDARRASWYRGEATAENLARLLPVPLSAEDLAAVLCGAAPLLPGRAVAAGPGRGSMRLEIAAGPLEQTLEVGPGAAVIRSRIGRRAEGRLEPVGCRISFDRLRSRGGTPFPTELKLEAEGGRSAVELDWGEDLAVNGPLPEGLFRLEPPPGARVQDLPAGAAPPVELPLAPGE